MLIAEKPVEDALRRLVRATLVRRDPQLDHRDQSPVSPGPLLIGMHELPVVSRPRLQQRLHPVPFEDLAALSLNLGC